MLKWFTSKKIHGEKPSPNSVLLRKVKSMIHMEGKIKREPAGSLSTSYTNQQVRFSPRRM